LSVVIVTLLELQLMAAAEGLCHIFKWGREMKKVGNHWSNGWRPGPDKVSQGGLKVLHLWRHSQKTAPPNQKIFFWVQTRTLAVSFDILTRSITLTGAVKFLCKATCISVFFSRKSPKPARRQSVERIGKSAMKKFFLVFGFSFFVGEVIRKIGLWPFLAAGTWLGPNH